MPKPLVKICGITRLEDLTAAAESGADFIGFNFVAGPRQIDDRTASKIIFDASRAVNTKISFVALCAIPSANYPKATAWSEIPALYHLRQIYGDDYAALASTQNLRFDWWMVRHVQDRSSIMNIAVEFGLLDLAPKAILLDTASKSVSGGTGQTFNWHWIAEARAAGELDGLPPIVLAGGLTPDNIAEAVRIVQPWAVDVSSGVEVPGKPGIKDAAKVRDFIAAAKGA